MTTQTASATGETGKSRTEEVFGKLPADTLVAFSPETPAKDSIDTASLFDGLLEPA